MIVGTQEDLTRSSFLAESAWLRFSSPLFSALMRACAADEDIIELGTGARAGQPVGLLFPIVAHYLLLQAPDCRLARYFPSLTDSPEPVEEAFPVFREFCLDHREPLAQLLATRTVNTNLVERASCILPAIAHASRLAEQPLTLVEICCSAGLNLLFDHYHYDYGAAGRIGVADSAVRLACRVIGSSSPPVSFVPQIVGRVGIDLVKVDPQDPLARLWMEAALCPEWRTEREHLRAALSVRAAYPLQIVAGNALDALPLVLKGLSGPVCVLHSYCMGQWTEAAKEALEEILRQGSRDREIHRLGLDTIYQEAPASTRGRLAKLAAAGIPIFRKSFPSLVEYTRYRKADAGSRLLGQADGFGNWLDWQLPPAN